MTCGQTTVAAIWMYWCSIAIIWSLLIIMSVLILPVPDPCTTTTLCTHPMLAAKRGVTDTNCRLDAVGNRTSNYTQPTEEPRLNNWTQARAPWNTFFFALKFRMDTETR